MDYTQRWLCDLQAEVRDLQSWCDQMQTEIESIRSMFDDTEGDCDPDLYQRLDELEKRVTAARPTLTVAVGDKL